MPNKNEKDNDGTPIPIYIERQNGDVEIPIVHEKNSETSKSKLTSTQKNNQEEDKYVSLETDDVLEDDNNQEDIQPVSSSSKAGKESNNNHLTTTTDLGTGALRADLNAGSVSSAQVQNVLADEIVEEYVDQSGQSLVSKISNRIRFDRLDEFLKNLKNYLEQNKNNSVEIRNVIYVINQFRTGKAWEKLGDDSSLLAQKHLLVRDLFDDLRDCLTKKNDAKVEKLYLKLFFKALKSYHLSAGASVILQAYVDQACQKNEKYAPSFNQALPSATITHTKSAKVKGGAGIDVPLSTAKATVTGAISASSAKVKNIAMDSAYSVERSYSLKLSGEIDAGIVVPYVAKLKFNGSASLSGSFISYEEQTSITGFMLLNFTNKHAWVGQYMSGTTGRNIADITRKVSNAYRRLRGVQTVVRDAPYFLTQAKVYLGSGVRSFLLEIATKVDQSLEINQTSTNSLSELCKKYYPAKNLFDQNAISDMNKAYGLLSDAVFNPKDSGVGTKNTVKSLVKSTDLRSHESSYSGRNYSADLSFDFNFNVGVGAGSGLMFFEEPSGDQIGQAEHKDSKTTGLKSVMPSVANIGVHVDGGVSWLSVPVGVNTLLSDAFNVHDKTPGGARRAITRVMEMLIDNQVFECKTALFSGLSDLNKQWIGTLKQAVIADRKTPIKKVGVKNEDSSDIRDAKLLKHGTEKVKAALNLLKATDNTISNDLVGLEKLLSAFYQDHLTLKKIQFLLIKEPDFLVENETATEQIRKHFKKMIADYWKVDEKSAVYRDLLSDAMCGVDENGLLNSAKSKVKEILSVKNPTKDQVAMGQVFMARTLDSFDLCLALIGVKIVASKMAGNNVDAETIERFKKIKRLIDGDIFELDKKTLRESSSVMLTSYIKDVRLAINASLKVEGPLVSKGFSSLTSDGSVIGVEGKVRFEIYNRYEFPNEVRKGLFIKIILDTKLSGIVGYLPFVVSKAVEVFKVHKPYGKNAENIARVLLETLSSASKVLLNNQVFSPSIGAGAEMIFRVSQERGWEWLNTKYFATHDSDFSLSTTNLIAMTPGTLSVSVSDYKKITDIKQYRLGNGLMSHFTTWRRNVNSKDGNHHSSVQEVLESLYTEREWKRFKVIGGSSPAELKNRKSKLELYQLDTEFFSNDCVAWVIQRYLNAYAATAGRVEILSSAVGRDDLTGQIGRFFGDKASRIFQDAANRLRQKQQQYAVDPEQISLIFDEPTPENRLEMLELLKKYRQRVDSDSVTFSEYSTTNVAKKVVNKVAGPIKESFTTQAESKKQALKDNVDYFLGTQDGRQLFLYYIKILKAVNCLTNFVGREDNLCYSPTIDGIPGNNSNKKVKQSDKETKESLKEAVKQFKASNSTRDQDDALPEIEPETPQRTTNKTFINENGVIETEV